ncbi:copper resistance CopC family protein [Umezawaea beigongshangensis]|uniref:copper resistance CopC family protein n=1 Tax=Umezawaea beigongshangensis TaxID=2780383 RepID=UPI0018F217A6|nr:copper resistance CopC family protein [Umezawaea beigongshangensis]
MRRWPSLLASAVIAGAMALGTAGPALAHNVLIGSDPANGSSVDAGPRQLTLTFDQPVQGGEDINTVTVIGPDGSHWEAASAPTIKDNVVTAQVRPLGPAAEYTVGYRILSADGHPVTGSVKFTLTTAGTGTPAPESEIRATGSAASGSASNSPDGGSGMPIWPWIVAAVVLLGGGVFLALRGGGGKEDGRA